MKQQNNPWFHLPQPNPKANLRLFCFPYAGGGTRIFRQWPNQLSNSIEICSIKLPGREGRIKEPPITRLTSLVDAIIPSLLTYLDKPFAFFGHSMGALICFEIAHQLLQLYGLSPFHLFVSGHRAPQLSMPNLDPPLHKWPEPDFIKVISSFNGIPPAVLQNRELMQFFIPILRADFAILETYVYQNNVPLNYPITAFGGLADPEVNQVKLEGWSQQTNQSFSLHMLPGDHFFIHSAESKLLQLLERSLI